MHLQDRTPFKKRITPKHSESNYQYSITLTSLHHCGYSEMQCKGGSEYPEGENWSTTAEAQKPSVAPKNYLIPLKLLTLALKALQDLGTPGILSPTTPSTSPAKWAFLFLCTPMFFLCSFLFLCLGCSNLHQRICKPSLTLKAKVKFLLSHKHLLQRK